MGLRAAVETASLTISAMSKKFDIPDSPPSREEINVYDSLDERCAEKNFSGKNLEEALAMFEDAFIYYQEDLMWMGPRAFRYYMRAAIKFITTRATIDDIGFFLIVVQYRLEFERLELKSVASEISDAIRNVVDHWETIEGSAEFYCDVPARLDKLRVEFDQLASG